MRFTLADRRSNISVGKPIYPRLCARPPAHANRVGWPVRGKYLFRLFVDVPAQDCSDGKDGLPNAHPKFAPVLISILYLHDIYYNTEIHANGTATRIYLSTENESVFNHAIQK